MPAVVLLVPGRFDARTGGSIYDRRVADALRARRWSVDVRELDGTFPLPASAALRHAAHVMAAVGDDATVVVDGLAFGAMPDEVRREADRLRLIDLVHMPLAHAAGLTPEAAATLEQRERRALVGARGVVVTGRSTADVIARYGVNRQRIAIIEPGTDRAPLARGSQGDVVQLLCVGAVTAGKGHAQLIRALAAIPGRQWRLTCAGSLDRDPGTARRVRSVISDCGVDDRVELAGELDETELAARYDRAHVFVLATLRETYGMAVAEALARGLPVVSTSTGSIPDLVGGSAGIVVPPDDPDALRDALARVISDRDLRGRLAAGARRVRAQLRSWEQAANEWSAVLEQVAAHGTVAL